MFVKTISPSNCTFYDTVYIEKKFIDYCVKNKIQFYRGHIPGYKKILINLDCVYSIYKWMQDRKIAIYLLTLICLKVKS